MNKIFLTSSVDVVVQDLVKNISDLKDKKLVFITTASEVEQGDLEWLNDDRTALINVGFDVTDYTFTGKNRNQIEQDLEPFDAIHIEGGNTFYLLQVIQQSDCTSVIRGLVEKGTMYIGSSAGSIIAGPDIYPVHNLDDISKAPLLHGYKGLGLVDFVVLPHWGNLHFKDEYLNQRMDACYNDHNKLVILTDNQYIYLEDNTYCHIDVRTNN